MTIDILRSTNPALSLSSYTEEATTTHTYLYGEPTPAELTPTDYATTRRTGMMAESTSRSKSAPPTEQDRDFMQRVDLLLENGARGYSYEAKRKQEHHGLLASSSSSTASSLRGNPEDTNPEVAKSVFLAPRNQHPTLTNNSTSIRNNSSDNILKVQEASHRLAKPINKSVSLQSLPTASQQSLSTKSCEGVLVLRPNPTKPNLPPLASKGMAGVIAPTPLVSQTPFAAANSPKPARPLPLSPHKTQTPVAASADHKKGQTQAAVEEKEAWCTQASEAARAEKEKQARIEKEKKARAEKEKQARAQEKKRQAEIRRLQELQCDFPDNSNNNNMASGRASVDEQAYGDDQQQQAQNAENSAGNGPQHEPATRTSRTGGDNVRGRRSSDDGSRNIQSTPVFQRLVTDEVRELQVYARMVENQNVELDKMRLFQKDLERRLQDESKRNEQLEATLEVREREWFLRFEELEREIKRLGGVVRAEENKNKSLVDQIRKKDQDIQGMLKKKYDHESAGARASVRSHRPERDRTSFAASSAFSKSPEANAHRSPDEHLRLLGSAEKVRERNTRHLLMDFFGL